MLKNILNLEGAQELSKKNQKEIVGGNIPFCRTHSDCGPQMGCYIDENGEISQFYVFCNNDRQCEIAAC